VSGRSIEGRGRYSKDGIETDRIRWQPCSNSSTALAYVRRARTDTGGWGSGASDSESGGRQDEVGIGKKTTSGSRVCGLEGLFPHSSSCSDAVRLTRVPAKHRQWLMETGHVVGRGGFLLGKAVHGLENGKRGLGSGAGRAAKALCDGTVFQFLHGTRWACCGATIAGA
jgi:hypothetical protein